MNDDSAPVGLTPEPHSGKMTPGCELIRQERERQISVEGWTPEHDDEHTDGSLAKAGSCYADVLMLDGKCLDEEPPDWPWGEQWWKPSADPIRNLVKAGALIAAEIDRLQRKQSKEAAHV